MDAGDPAECDDGMLGPRSLGPGEGAPTSGADQTLAVPSTAAGTGDDTSDSQGWVLACRHFAAFYTLRACLISRNLVFLRDRLFRLALVLLFLSG